MDRQTLSQSVCWSYIGHTLRDRQMEKWDRQEGRQRKSDRWQRQRKSDGWTDTAFAAVLDVTLFIHLERWKGTEKIRWPDRHSQPLWDRDRKSDGQMDTLSHWDRENQDRHLQPLWDRDRKSDGQTLLATVGQRQKIRWTLLVTGTETGNQVDRWTLLTTVGQRQKIRWTDTLSHCGTETENQMDTLSRCGTETENQMDRRTLLATVGQRQKIRWTCRHCLSHCG